MVGSEDVAAGRETGREIIPQCDSGHVKKWLGNAVGADACQTTEDEHVHDGGEQGLDEIPSRTEDGLLILRDDVTLDVHPIQVAIAPEASDVDVEPFLLWLNMADNFSGIYCCLHISIM